eukprot:TRINITY_DN11478_c0_g2_i1.p1 TRINITY_DN11478_c0_g2~~TRINITY_DN11478_c0_g2_i1.p1  ORF type:complete len:545 (+),score=136.19 TRINITY_DN11478_c0_g2_i1:77-1711(+)
MAADARPLPDGEWVFRDEGRGVFCIVVEGDWAYFGASFAAAGPPDPQQLLECISASAAPAADARQTVRGRQGAAVLELEIAEPSGGHRMWVLARDAAAPWRHSWNHVPPDIAYTHKLNIKALQPAQQPDDSATDLQSGSGGDFGDTTWRSGSSLAGSVALRPMPPDKGKRGASPRGTVLRATPGGGSAVWPPCGGLGPLEQWCAAALWEDAAAAAEGVAVGQWDVLGNTDEAGCPVVTVVLQADGAVTLRLVPADDEAQQLQTQQLADDDGGDDEPQQVDPPEVTVPAAGVVADLQGRLFTATFNDQQIAYRLRVCGAVGTLQWGARAERRTRRSFTTKGRRVSSAPHSRSAASLGDPQRQAPQEYSGIVQLALAEPPAASEGEQKTASAQSAEPQGPPVPQPPSPRRLQLLQLGGRLRLANEKDEAPQPQPPARRRREAAPRQPKRSARDRRLESCFNADLDPAPGIPDIFCRTNKAARYVAGCDPRAPPVGGADLRRIRKVARKAPLVRQRPGPRTHITEPPPGTYIDGSLPPRTYSKRVCI